MAVYTNVTADEISTFLKGYDLGGYVGHKGITQGVENTNYHLHTSTGRYILTIFEKRIKREDLPFVFGFTEHLKNSGMTVSDTYKNNAGAWVGTLVDKPAAVIRYLDGASMDDAAITPDICSQLGKTLAQMHLAATHFGGVRTNPVSLEQWKKLLGDAIPKTDLLDNDTKYAIDITLKDYETLDMNELPRGAIHGDIFPDNVFFQNGQLTGVIDFYFGCTAPFVYDLAITVNAWCFETNGTWVPARFEAFSKAYEAVRPLNGVERGAFTTLRRAAALRFISTRLYDWVFTPAGADVVKKDPMEYIKKLKVNLVWP